MNKRLLSVIFIVVFLFSVVVIPQLVCCQTAAPSDSSEPTTDDAGSGFNLLLIGGIVAVVAVVVVVVGVVFVKKRVNEKSLKRFPPHAFEDWVIKKFNGKASDISTGVNGYTEGGQPLLILQSDHVSLPEVEDFVKVLVNGKAQKGAMVAFGFDNDTLDGKVTAMDNGIELQLLRVSELLNKRYVRTIQNIARSQATFDGPPPTYMGEDQAGAAPPFEERPNMPNAPQGGSLRPRVFVSNSNTKVAEQVKWMLEFLRYDYVMGDNEETSVPIPEGKFGVMQGCDCAIINVAAAEQERRYSGLYILNSNVTSEINAAYLKYNTQVVLLVERKVDLPTNLRGLKIIEYDSDDLSFNAAMDLDKALAEFKKI
jgi:hypothetical protein